MTGAIGLPLAMVMEWGRRKAEEKPQQPQSDDPFAQQLAEAVSRSIDRATQSGRAVEITIQERQSAGAETGNRQYVITVAPSGLPAAAQSTITPLNNGGNTSNGGAAAPPAAAPAAALNSPTPARPEPDRLPIIPAATSGSVFDMENPIPRVQQRMRELGLDYSGAQFELLDETASGIGGTIVNHYMRVRTPNGWKEDFAVEYILRNPSITANEIAGMMRRPPAPSHLRGI